MQITLQLSTVINLNYLASLTITFPYVVPTSTLTRIHGFYGQLVISKAYNYLDYLFHIIIHPANSLDTQNFHFSFASVTVLLTVLTIELTTHHGILVSRFVVVLPQYFVNVVECSLIIQLTYYFQVNKIFTYLTKPLILYCICKGRTFRYECQV